MNLFMPVLMDRNNKVVLSWKPFYAETVMDAFFIAKAYIKCEYDPTQVEFGVLPI